MLFGCLIATVACSDESPTELEVTFGETTVVVLVNPLVNDDNATSVPAPGSEQCGVPVTVTDGPSVTTNANRELREVVVASEASTAGVMAEVPYAFGGQVIEITPSMSLADVNDALAQSIDGSGLTALGNAGMSPVAPPTTEC